MIEDLYVQLHELGFAHSVECWKDGVLAGGLYGVSLQARILRRETLFSRARDASKVALVHLVARLIAGDYRLLDTQYVTEHLRSFGAVEIPRRRYRTLLDKAIAGEPADFLKCGYAAQRQRRRRARDHRETQLKLARPGRGAACNAAPQSRDPFSMIR